MYLNDLLEKKNMSRYRLSKESGVPQTTITDICNNKANIEKCSAETIYKIAKVMNVSMESLIRERMEHKETQEKRPEFEVFKSNVCHLVKDKGDADFIIEVLSKDEIRELYNRQWYREAFYLLAMLDYLSRENNIELCTRYDDIRSQKLSEIIYPKGIVLSDMASETDKNRKECLKNAIPEFLRFNIVESEIRNVC